ncbi:MAG: ABC transporter permease [Rhizobiaceae bacterium]|jgi:NitT/TauT family transport system permease protein|nr:ABC transporter permease [Rhizobiaceae bacterium]
MSAAIVQTQPVIDAEEQARVAAERREKIGRWLIPTIVVILTIVLWDRLVVWNEVPHYIVPRPYRVWDELVKDWPFLLAALETTLSTTFLGLGIAVVGGVLLAILFNQSKWAEMSFFPYAVILQVTPIVAIFPIINGYIDSRMTKLLLATWLVAFFPILSNTTMGLRSVDSNLRDLFRLNGATKWQTLIHLQLPAALPYFLSGLKIAGGLALIGAIVAEFVAGATGNSFGLASVIIEASYRLNRPRSFAALALIAIAGVAIFIATSFLSWFLLRKWHESAIKRDH